MIDIKVYSLSPYLSMLFLGELNVFKIGVEKAQTDACVYQHLSVV